MDSIVDFDEPTRVIMHFAEDEALCAQHGHRLIHYQVLIDNDSKCYSPNMEYIRFEHGTSEVHGWIKVDSVIIDTVLETEVEGDWVRSANG
jgi:hypothetical protein